jgi:quercetin dioxygenase-like cupin family protein
MAKSSAGQAAAKVKIYKFDKTTVSIVEIPPNGMVKRHIHRTDYVIIPLTDGKLRYTLFEGEKVIGRRTSTLSVGKPKYFEAGPNGRDVELLNLGGHRIIMGKVAAGSPPHPKL